MDHQSNVIPGRRVFQRRFILSLLTVVSLTALSSILVLAFRTDSASVYNSLSCSGHCRVYTSWLPPNPPNDTLVLALYPQSLDLRLLKPTLAVAGITLPLSIGIGLLCIHVLYGAKALLITNIQRSGTFGILGANSLLSVVTCVVGLFIHFQSSSFDSSYRSPATNNDGFGPENLYDRGTFDLASWSCQVSAHGGLDDGVKVLHRQCIDETVTLWVKLTMALLNWAMMALVWIDWKGSKLLLRDFGAFTKEQESFIGERNS